MWLRRRSRSNHTGLQRLQGWGPVSQGTVRPDGGVVLPPPLDEHLGLEQRVERFAGQQLVPKLPVEVLLAVLSFARPSLRHTTRTVPQLSHEHWERSREGVTWQSFFKAFMHGIVGCRIPPQPCRVVRFLLSDTGHPLFEPANVFALSIRAVLRAIPPGRPVLKPASLSQHRAPAAGDSRDPCLRRARRSAAASAPGTTCRVGRHGDGPHPLRRPCPCRGQQAL